MKKRHWRTKIDRKIALSGGKRPKYEYFFIIEAYYGGPTLVEEPLETLEARETPLEAALL